MNLRIPRKLAFFGSLMIALSGLVNTALGIRINALIYDVYPGGKMGHVGVIAGIGALLLGLIMVFGVMPLYTQRKRSLVILGGVLTIVLGHVGAVWGAIYVGTVGLLLCYVAGFWTITAVIIDSTKKAD